MRAALQQHLSDLVQDLLDEAGAPGPPPDFTLEAPRSEDHGDFACNAAMLLAKTLRQPPRAIAERLAERLASQGGLVARVEVAGPGFVNIWLAESRWRSLLQSVLAAGAHYGESATGAGQRVQVEFVSANPTGPLTLGHGRQAVLGDALIFNGPDWTTTQADMDNALDLAGLDLLFYQPQYGALSSFSTIGNSHCPAPAQR